MRFFEEIYYSFKLGHIFITKAYIVDYNLSDLLYNLFDNDIIEYEKDGLYTIIDIGAYRITLYDDHDMLTWMSDCNIVLKETNKLIKKWYNTSMSNKCMYRVRKKIDEYIINKQRGV